MGRYSKIASKYILAKFHQDTYQGPIYERDWTTIGNVHRLEPGKRPYYSNSGFLFTDNAIPAFKKKRKSGNWVGEYTYEDVKNAEDVVNLIKINTDSENLSDYAYWGSMTELFRGSVEHIIKTFPGRLRSTKNKLQIHHHFENENNGVEYWDEAPGYILDNPFEVDMHTDTDTGEFDSDDILRFVAFSWRQYVLEDYDGTETLSFPITSYTIIKDVYRAYDCEGRYFLLCSIVIFCGQRTIIVDTYLADGKIVYCYRENDDPSTYEFLITYFSGLPDNRISFENSSTNDITSDITNDVSISYAQVPDEFAICPNKSVLEEYFKKLDGFEWKLLNIRSKPYYVNTFLLPVQLNNGNWKLVSRKYTWPSEGIWIDIESTDYDDYINNMLELCETYDSLWCDSIWRCMVHESVKNFDWSYRREYADNDTEDNIEGGNQMKDVMRLYGIIYDKAKRYVDGIGFYNRITYDGYNNCPTALISDRNTLQGWDVISTQHVFYWYELIDDIYQYDDYHSLPVLPVNVGEENPEHISVTCEGASDALYYKKNFAPVSDIYLGEEFFSQGSTIVGKQENPWVDDNVYHRVYVEVGYESIPPGYDFSLQNRTLNEYPYQLFEDVVCPPFVQVVNSNKTRYYKLLDENEISVNNLNYVNKTWFENVNSEIITPATTDIVFNRTLNLSSNRILKTKGTKEAIEMAFGLFGLGAYDAENPYGDYVIEEQYCRFTAKQTNDIFYFYETISPEEAQGHNPVSVESIPKNPSENSVEYIVISNDAFDTYYKLNGEYTVGEAIEALYAHRTTERIYNDYYSGVPLGEVVYGNNRLIIPFFDNRKIYEGNLYYESNGAWMNTGNNTWENSETIPYLHILQRIEDLFNVNSMKANNGDIYYVADISNYYKYTENTPYYLSNFFKLNDKYNISRFSSWVNVPIEGPIQNGGYSGIEGVTRDDYLHAKHLNDIIPSILYNNPHTGYDRYDLGAEYKSYMETPYKYSFENYMYDDEYYQNMAEQFAFAYENVATNDKSEITATTISYEDGAESPNAETQTVTLNDKYLKLTLLENGQPIDASDAKYRMHLEYVRNVVLKYVAQVIPSTTILVLDNFETPDEISNDIVSITAQTVGEGVVYGTGEYLKSTMVTLNAVPAEGYHFAGWRALGRAIPQTPSTQQQPQYYSFENTITVMACSNTEYTAVFVEDCEITFGCETVRCSTNPDSY